MCVLCFICKEPVNLEDCKTDELGRAVHENCYFGAIQMMSRGKNLPWTSPGASRRIVKRAKMTTDSFLRVFGFSLKRDAGTSRSRAG